MLFESSSRTRAETFPPNIFEDLVIGEDVVENPEGARCRVPKNCEGIAKLTTRNIFEI